MITILYNAGKIKNKIVVYSEIKSKQNEIHTNGMLNHMRNNVLDISSGKIRTYTSHYMKLKELYFENA